MSVIMVSLHLQDGVTLTEVQDGQPVKQQISAPEIRAHLVLTPDGDPDLAPLGFVHLRIEAQPRSLPAMTPRDTVVWLAACLAKGLATSGPPPA
jgi:hypothetical protein